MGRIASLEEKTRVEGPIETLAYKAHAIGAWRRFFRLKLYQMLASLCMIVGVHSSFQNSLGKRVLEPHPGMKKQVVGIKPRF